MVARHILEILFKEMTVGHGHYRAVLGFHTGGDNPDVKHLASHAFVFHNVAGTQSARHQSQTGEEIFKRVLQGKTDTHAGTSDSGNKSRLVDVKNKDDSNGIAKPDDDVADRNPNCHFPPGYLSNYD